MITVTLRCIFKHRTHSSGVINRLLLTRLHTVAPHQLVTGDACTTGEQSASHDVMPTASAGDL